MLDPKQLRNDFPALQQERNGKPMIYFDNASMTLKPDHVIAAMDRYYYSFPSCGGKGRSIHWFAKRVRWEVDGNAADLSDHEAATDFLAIEGAREKVRRFINAGHAREIIFTRNTTEGLNLVARSFPFRTGAVVLTTDREHNSNLCPWKELEKRGVIRHLVVPSHGDNTFDLNRYEEMLEQNDVQLVSMVHTANLDGYTIPAAEIIRLAHARGARVMFDAAQSVAHSVLDVRALDVDFVAFSVHKMCGPSGMGVMYGKAEMLEDPNFGPFLVGGDTVKDTFHDAPPVYDVPPFKFEAGLQNYAGIIGAGAAVDYLTGVGMANIAQHERELNCFLTERLREYEDQFAILGPRDPNLRGGIITLCAKRPLPVTLTKPRFLEVVGHLWDITRPGEVEPGGEVVGLDPLLNGWSNIMVRSGYFCAHSWFHSRGLPGDRTTRISVYLYNTKQECEILLRTLKAIVDLPEFRACK
jgi:cysteine desulfurase/selenocysteine lyase